MSKKDTDCISKKELEKKVQELAFLIDEVEDEKLEVENKLKKALADYINLEGGINRRVEAKLEQEKLILARDLIEVIDDFYYALQAGRNLKMDDATKSWIEGIKSTIEKNRKILEKLGVKMMDIKKNTDFDMSKCEAIGTVTEGKQNTIYEVAQPGYIMGDHVVRPARVIVCKK
jgi:molecular chaperone GrpE